MMANGRPASGRVVQAHEINAVLAGVASDLAASDRDELRGVGGDETVSERCTSYLPPGCKESSTVTSLLDASSPSTPSTASHPPHARHMSRQMLRW
jgi:hypothetical protein